VRSSTRLAAVKEARAAHLKVILETASLGATTASARRARSPCSRGLISSRLDGQDHAGGDAPGDARDAEAIRDFYYATAGASGMKPAGGIRTAKQALHYLVMVKETLGDAWLHARPLPLRGLDALNDVLMQLEKERTGVYQGGDYFSKID
jgi:deoxyribose-phosphate aldolase